MGTNTESCKIFFLHKEVQWKGFFFYIFCNVKRHCTAFGLELLGTQKNQFRYFT
jgi:hypothetical protein